MCLFAFAFVGGDDSQPATTPPPSTPSGSSNQRSHEPFQSSLCVDHPELTNRQPSTSAPPSEQALQQQPLTQVRQNHDAAGRELVLPPREHSPILTPRDSTFLFSREPTFISGPESESLNWPDSGHITPQRPQPRRSKFRYTEEQEQVLRQAFQENRYCSARMRRDLVVTLGLRPCAIQVETKFSCVFSF